MDFLERNLSALARQDHRLAQLLAATPPAPEAVLEPSKSGPPALRLGQTRLTSSVDPAQEGMSQAALAPPGPLAAFGFGLGYHLEPLAGRDVVVWEPDPGLLRLALSARDLTALLEHIRLVVDPAQLGDLGGRSPYVHRPSARLHPALAEGLIRRLDQSPPLRQRPERPRVLVVPPLLGGTLASAYWCAQALDHLGCQVRTLPLQEMAPLYRLMFQEPQPPERLDRLRAPMVRFLGELTVLKAEEFQPDLVLALAQAPLDRRALAELRRLGLRTAFWFAEDHRLMVYFREVAASYDHFFHIQGPQMERELDRLGANHSYLPVAAHPPQHRPLELTELERKRYGAAVGFMGAGYPNRLRIFTELVEKGLDLRLWGVDWPRQGPLAACLAEKNRYLDSDEVVKIYNACQVVINLHSSFQAAQGIGGADFVNPRTLEVPACGGFQLVDQVPRLAEFLIPEQEVATFRDQDELLEKVRHYLDHPGQRQALAQAGRRKVLSQHTYYHRLERLLTICLGQAPQAAQPRAPQDQPAAGAAVEMMLNRLAAAAA